MAISENQQQQQQSPYQIAMDFNIHLAKVYDDLTGSISKLEELPPTVLADGTRIPNLVQISKRDPNSKRICSEDAARKIVHSIRNILNQHNSFADLTRDDIARIAGDSARQAIVPIMASPQTYEVSSLSDLEAEGLGLFDIFFIFMTGLKDAGIRKAAGQMYTVSVTHTDREDNQKVIK
jgi:hypothetical protein